MADKNCSHTVVYRSIDKEEWKCTACGVKFCHFEDIGFPRQKLTIMEPYATLRDQFAIATIVGLWQSGKVNAEKVAVLAYQMADAMMEARKK